MTIHSELIYEITREENLIKIAFERPSSFRLMPLDFKLIHERSKHWIPMSPDVLINLRNAKSLAVEMESDIKYDFDSSMRQIIKYLKNYDKVTVVIPRFYRKFAELYQNEGVRVFLWNAKRVWHCMDCEEETIDPRTIKPKCEHCGETQLRLKGLTDFELELVSN